MSWDLKCTITVDENQVKELADGLGNKYAATIEELSKENNEIMESRGALQRENTELKKEIQELKDEIQELKDENEKLIQMGIDLSGWIYSLAKYSSDANNKLKANVWFEGVKRKYFSEVTYGGNK